MPTPRTLKGVESTFSQTPIPVLSRRVRIACLVMGAGLLLISAASIFWDYRGHEKTVIQETSTLSQALVQQVDQIFTDADLSLTQMNSDLAAAGGALSPARVREVLRRNASSYRWHLFSFFLDADGHPLAFDPDLERLPDAGLWMRARPSEAEQGLWIGVPLKTARGLGFLPLTKPLMDRSGRVIGFAGVALSVDYFLRFFQDFIGGGNLNLNILSRNGPILLRLPWREDLVGQDLRSKSSVYAYAEHSGTGYFYEYSPVLLTEAFYFFRSSAQFPIFVLISLRKDQMFSPWVISSVHRGLLALFSLGTILVLWLLLESWFRRLNDERRAIQIAEEKAKATSRMQALGALAGSLARDLMSILYRLSTQTRRLEENLQSMGDKTDVALRLRQVLKRARDLVGQVLAFSAADRAPTKVVDLHHLLEEEAQLVRPGLPVGVELIIKSQPGLFVQAAPGRLDQVFLNLCANALDAMKDGGTLTLAARREGAEVVVEVSDTGMGIPPEILPRIFDPLFSTKAFGEGTGIGLSIVKTIVQEHGATIEAQSRPDQGTRFVLRFPASSAQVPSPETDSVPRVLFVDSTRSVVTLIRDFFEMNQIPHLCLPDGFAALKEQQAHPDQYRLVVMDRQGPGWRGDDLLKEMRKGRPSLPAVLTIEPGQDEGNLPPQTWVLRKPYGLQQFLEIMLRFGTSGGESPP